MNRNLLRSFLIAASLVLGFDASAADAPAAAAPKQQPRRPEYDDSILQAMDHGPFYNGSIHGKRITLKGVALKLDGGEAGATFDTELLRLSEAWTGGYLQIKGERTTGGHPVQTGTSYFTTPQIPGWARGGSFDDPRPEIRQNRRNGSPGPLPRDWAKWKGAYRFGNEVVLSYTVGPVDVLEQPKFVKHDGVTLFSRSFEMGRSFEANILNVAELPTPAARTSRSPLIVLEQPNDMVFVAGLVGGPKDTLWESTPDGRLFLHLPEGPKTSFEVFVFRGPAKDLGKISDYATRKASRPNLSAKTRGGSRIWGQPLLVPGKLAPTNAPGAYVVDTITVPEENPYKSWIRCSGVDFFPDGRAAVCSLSGDVWIVSNIDNKLDKVTWQRFATGLYQPLGLKIVDNKIYVITREQLTRLHDLNSDGEADFIENFNNDISITDHYHEFVLNLETDSAGNFYFTKGGNLGEATIPHHGTLCRISKDGLSLTVVSTGLRAPNGLGMGPNDEITTADNEGNWIPSSKVTLMREGTFAGHMFTAHVQPKPTGFDQPIFWLPHTYDVDNSSGGQVWVKSDKWGPFNGHMLHTSYGAGLLFNCFSEEVDGVLQGGAVRFPINFDSGVMRGRFRPQDGQLYLVGLNVWQSNNKQGQNKRGIFQRVRYTGKPANLPTAVHVTKKALVLEFSDPLDPASAADVQNYSVDRWNYKWTQAYGSPEFKVSEPEVKGRELQDVKSATLSADGRSVSLQIDDLKPAMQSRIRYQLKAANGDELKSEVYHTINRMPGGPGIEVAVGSTK